MMDFMPGKGEHETGQVFFATFTGKSGATVWPYVHVDMHDVTHQ